MGQWQILSPVRLVRRFILFLNENNMFIERKVYRVNRLLSAVALSKELRKIPTATNIENRERPSSHEVDAEPSWNKLQTNMIEAVEEFLGNREISNSGRENHTSIIIEATSRWAYRCSARLLGARRTDILENMKKD